MSGDARSGLCHHGEFMAVDEMFEEGLEIIEFHFHAGELIVEIDQGFFDAGETIMDIARQDGSVPFWGTGFMKSVLLHAQVKGCAFLSFAKRSFGIRNVVGRVVDQKIYVPPGVGRRGGLNRIAPLGACGPADEFS
jgi:hypothetical protein